MTARAAIILAAGQGTRMRSSLPKVLHHVGGRAMLDWSIAQAEAVGCERIVVVTNPQAPEVARHVAARLGEAAVATQDPPMGTGHAIRCAEASLSGFSGDVIVLYADTPFIPATAIEALFEKTGKSAGVGVLGFGARQPGMYGRLITDDSGALLEIVEARDANADQLAINLCNSGVMAASAETMFSLLKEVKNDNAKQEYYLTDIVGLARQQGKPCAVVHCKEAEVLGINSRDQLADAEAIFQQNRRRAFQEAGVTLRAPETVHFAFDTEIAADVEIEPYVVFGPGVSVARGTRLKSFCHIEGARIAEDCDIGPYARLRPGTVLEAGVRIGNFVEVKNTVVGAGAKANHLSYLGDGEVGAEANIGAGTIFCNYDGFLKYKTRVGRGAFIGSNSALVAPVTIGDGAYVGSGSVVSKDVEANALVVARGKQIERAGWATAFRERMAAIKAAKKSG